MGAFYHKDSHVSFDKTKLSHKANETSFVTFPAFEGKCCHIYFLPFFNTLDIMKIKFLIFFRSKKKGFKINGKAKKWVYRKAIITFFTRNVHIIHD